MESKIALFKSIADRNRLRILMALIANDELCACQIIELLQFTGATVSRHLAQLTNAGLIKSRKDGRWVYFSLNNNNDGNKKFLEWLFKELKESKEYLEDCKSLKKILNYDPVVLCKKQRGENCC